MKSTVFSILSLALFSSHPLHGEPDDAKTAQEQEVTWIKESELPVGFPDPGPFDEVVQKSYPAYRAAVTKTSGPNRGFWTLFQHINRKDIAMTAPVEMTMAENKDGELEMREMSFLYRHPDQGSLGPDGKKVEVVNLPKLSVLSYAWRGGRSDKKISEVKALLQAEAEKKKLSGSGYRLLGYNSPSVPNAKKTHELQLVLK